MQLIDLNQMMLTGLISNINPKDQLDELLMRHIILNTLRSYVKRFRNDFGEAILCCDSRGYWRKAVFPYYKCQRKDEREKSSFDWNAIFKVTNTLKEDLKAKFPYKVIEVYGAEADDIIAVLCKKYHIHESILILSSDKDFLQLQKYNNIQQINLKTKEFMVSDHPKEDLIKKIFTGDPRDGIPNILSSDSVFNDKQRQKPLTKKQLYSWLSSSNDLDQILTEEQYANFKRNDLLINFDNIPEELTNKIITKFDTVKPNPKQKMYEYFVENEMINFINCIEDF